MTSATNTPQGWLCPACGKAHGPHITTCPDAQVTAPMPAAPPYRPVPIWWGVQPEWNGWKITSENTGPYITWNDAGSIGPKSNNWKNGSMTLMDVAPVSSDNTP
jgi:hypothetical protein